MNLVAGAVQRVQLHPTSTPARHRSSRRRWWWAPASPASRLFDIAEAGYKVYLASGSRLLGQDVELNKTFPTLDCAT